jgi:hypothetical protein
MGGCSSTAISTWTVRAGGCRQVRQEGLDSGGAAVPVQGAVQQLEVAAQ